MRNIGVYTLDRFFVSVKSVDLIPFITAFIPVRYIDGLTQICLGGLPRWYNLNHSTRAYGKPEIISSQGPKVPKVGHPQVLKFSLMSTTVENGMLKTCRLISALANSISCDKKLSAKTISFICPKARTLESLLKENALF